MTANLREPRIPGAAMPFVADHCEAKLHGFRRTQDGVVVSFVLHPAEIPKALALDPLGTRYMLAFAQISDDEHPVSPAGPAAPVSEKGDCTTVAGAVKPAGEPKERRSWDELRPSQQAGILCSDVAFQQFASKQTGWQCDEEDAAAWLRAELDISSRKELDLRPDLAPKLNQVREEFMRWAGRVPESR
jgi:hypothetical protein